jgi:hypothetical protein
MARLAPQGSVVPFTCDSFAAALDWSRRIFVSMCPRQLAKVSMVFDSGNKTTGISHLYKCYKKFAPFSAE